MLRPIGVRQQGNPQTSRPRFARYGATDDFIVNQSQLLFCLGGKAATLPAEELEVGKTEAQQDQYGDDLH